MAASASLSQVPRDVSKYNCEHVDILHNGWALEKRNGPRIFELGTEFF